LVLARIGAGLGEVSAERVTQRNGHRAPPYYARASELELRIPEAPPQETGRREVLG
jgi:hypothetical protein